VNLAVALAALALIGAAPSSSGAVYVTSLPSGADVWVDGTYLGRAPLVLGALSAGLHRLTLTRTGWTAQDVAVTVVADATATASVVLARDGKLAAGNGWLGVHGPAVGTLTVDGERHGLGKDGMVAVPTGVHVVAFDGPNGRIERTVDVYPDMRTDVLIQPNAPARSVVIAPVDDYVPADALVLAGTSLTLRFHGHDVVARLGSTSYTVDHRAVTYDAAPTVIKNRVYLPIELLTYLTAGAKT
jgi:hypothetical protein